MNTSSDMGRIDMGLTASGATASLDLEELLATRLLVQGNSGSGKSYLLRRLLEQSAPVVQQAIIDPEGDFVSLAEKFGHVVVDSASHSEAALQQLGARARQHRVSVVLNLENLDAEGQMRHAAAFLGGMFDVDRDYWFPVLVVVDEAQMFAPAAAGEVSDEARKASLGAMTNLMCRGRKRGLAGVIATQRLAKLAKNVAAEASNFLMGRTFLDIDMARAADLLGMERKQAEMFRDLERGRFIALGPALCRRPLPIRIGEVQTFARAVSPKLMPLPERGDEARDLIFKPGENEVPRYSARRPPPSSTAEVLAQLAAQPLVDVDRVENMISGEANLIIDCASIQLDKNRDQLYKGIIKDIAGDGSNHNKTVNVLYQSFLEISRSRGINGRLFSFQDFRLKLALARAEIPDDIQDSENFIREITPALKHHENIVTIYAKILEAAGRGQGVAVSLDIPRLIGSHSMRRIDAMVHHLLETGLVDEQEHPDGVYLVKAIKK